MKKIFPILISSILISLSLSAQVQINNTVLHNEGSVIAVVGNTNHTVSNSSVINNLGNIYFFGNFCC